MTINQQAKKKRESFFQRKAQVETSLNWVFMVLSGAVILLFFTVVIYNVQTSSVKEAQSVIVNRMSSIFAGTELGQRTSAVIEDLPDSELTFSCQGYTLGEFTGAYESRLTFAPSELNLQPLIIWARDWNMPFFVSNFLFITNPNIKYVFVSDNTVGSRTLKTKIQQALPQQVNAEYIAPTARITYGNQYSTRFIFLDTDPNSYPFDSSFVNTKFTVTKISSQYNIEFYNNLNKENLPISISSPIFDTYYDDNTMLAAVITDSQELYRCMIIKAFRRYEQVSAVTNQRVNDLKTKKYACANFYGTGISSLNEQVSIFYNKLNTETLTGAEHQNFISMLPSLLSAIEKTNREVLPKKSCPLIY